MAEPMNPPLRLRGTVRRRESGIGWGGKLQIRLDVKTDFDGSDSDVHVYVAGHHPLAVFSEGDAIVIEVA